MKLGRTSIVIAEKDQVLLNEQAAGLVIGKQKRYINGIGSSAFGHVRTIEKQETVRLFREGWTANSDILDHFFNHCISHYSMSEPLLKPNLVAAIPSSVSDDELRILREALIATRVHRVHFVPRMIACAVSANLPINQHYGGAILYLGGVSSEAAIISNGGVSICSSVESAGLAIDSAFIDYAKTQYSLLIGERMAERAKTEIGSLIPNYSEHEVSIARGRNLVTGNPDSVEVHPHEMRDIVVRVLSPVADMVREFIDDLDPSFRSAVQREGFILTGGTALIPGIDSFLSEQLGVPMRLADDPVGAAAIGASRIAQTYDWKRHKLG